MKVIAELLEVDKKDVQLSATERTLTINVDTLERKYYKELGLPAEVDEALAKCIYKNGILEIVFGKKEREPR